MPTKRPEIIVTLTDHYSNAFTVLGCCREAAQESSLPGDDIATFTS